ncbi:MAG: 4-(cytidine 5'-diphospho)-2-C-methyl-D-erythritol kinase, partial [Pseudomonadota bacterium]|nr:4-(cytidine 5'-diphospho)-2-C-methyl-D-erythritol kinase [Pseudomonadota bacterium]
PQTPPLPAVLVNPGRPSPTGAVYRAYDAGRVRAADPPHLPSRFGGPAEVAESLASTRNDLEAPAAALEPAIVVVLGELRRRPETLLARMSGSGATCFALCATVEDAERLAAWLQGLHPQWWVRPCVFPGTITKS